MLAGFDEPGKYPGKWFVYHHLSHGFLEYNQVVDIHNNQGIHSQLIKKG